MKRVLLQVTLMTVVLATTAAYVPAEDLEWTTWEMADGGSGHEYTVLMSEGTWLEQAAAAEALGGYLATVLCAGEQEFVWDLVRGAELESPTSHDYYAFGLLQSEDAVQADEGWYWLTGEELDEDAYENWGYREPNNYRGIEHWGAIHKTRGTWNDVRNNSPYRAIVEREGPPAEDSTPPVTSLNEADPAVLQWSDAPVAVTISGSATDAESGVATAMLVISDEYDELSGELDVTELLGADGGFSTTLELDATVQPGDADGRSYMISLVAVDNAGNEAEPVSISVLAVGDSTPPSVRLASPDPATLPHQQPNVLKNVVISGNVTDDESGVESARIIVNDDYGEFDQEHDVTEQLNEVGDFELTLQLSSRVNGGDVSGRTYEITLVATDRAGNGPVEDAVTVVAHSGASGGRGNAPDTPPGHDRRPDTPNRGGR